MYQVQEFMHHLISIIIILPLLNQIKPIKIETSFTRVTWPRKAAVHLIKETDKKTSNETSSGIFSSDWMHSKKWGLKN